MHSSHCSQMEVFTALVILLTLAVCYYARQLKDLWRYYKIVLKIPTNKAHPIFGHALYFMVPENRK